ncbi:hypothetical protein D3C76_1389030 [compost metagenome]
MSEQITWTHVDKLVRKMHDEKGMLPIGLTDAEVAHAFIGWLERRNANLILDAQQMDERCDRLEVELMKLRNAPKSKTKQRLEALEKAVEELQGKPSAPVYGPRGQCSVHGCLDPATTPDGLCSGHFY